jgi:heme-degrading monooxygenase HmoA
MYVVRDVFRCKPGHSKSLAERFKKSQHLAQKLKGFVSARVLIDYVASYWTVVLEFEVKSLEDFEMQMNEYSASPEFREAMKGYMDEVDGGHREIFKIA